MIVICWICVVLNLIGGSLFYPGFNKNAQEKAGRDMAKIAGNLFVLIAVTGIVLLWFQLPLISIIVTIVPALIVCKILFRVIKEY